MLLLLLLLLARRLCGRLHLHRASILLLVLPESIALHKLLRRLRPVPTEAGTGELGLQRLRLRLLLCLLLHEWIRPACLEAIGRL